MPYSDSEQKEILSNIARRNVTWVEGLKVVATYVFNSNNVQANEQITSRNGLFNRLKASDLEKIRDVLTQWVEEEEPEEIVLSRLSADQKDALFNVHEKIQNLIKQKQAAESKAVQPKPLIQERKRPAVSKEPDSPRWTAAKPTGAIWRTAKSLPLENVGQRDKKAIEAKQRVIAEKNPLVVNVIEKFYRAIQEEGSLPGHDARIWAFKQIIDHVKANYTNSKEAIDLPVIEKRIALELKGQPEALKKFKEGISMKTNVVIETTGADYSAKKTKPANSLYSLMKEEIDNIQGPAPSSPRKKPNVK